MSDENTKTTEDVQKVADDVVCALTTEIPPAVTPPKKRKNRVTWTDKLDEILCRIFLKQKEQGKFTSGGKAKRSAWQELSFEFDSAARTSYGNTACKNRMDKLKKSYIAYKRIMELSGGGVQHGRLPDAAWEEFVTKHPHTKPFRYKDFPQYEIMSLIYGENVVSGDLLTTATNYDHLLIRAGSTEQEDETDASGADINPRAKKTPRKDAKKEALVRTTPKTAALTAIASAMTAWSESKTTGDPLAVALKKIEEDTDLSDEQRFAAMDYFGEQPGMAKIYVNIQTDSFRRRWLVRKLEQ